MSESSSALTSIADDGEFRFARFYIVCEAVPLGTLGNPLIVCGLSDTFRGLSKRGRDTESDAKIRQEEMHTFFSNECSICIPAETEMHVLLVRLFATSKGTVCSMRQTVPDRTLFEIQMLCDDSGAHKVQNDNDDDRVNVAGGKQ